MHKFLSQFKILLRFFPAIATVIIVILAFLHDNQGIALLTMIFGGGISIIQIIKVLQMMTNLKYLQQRGLYEQMVKETPEHNDSDYVLTPTFVFSYKKGLCLPISDIQGCTLQMVRYVNSAAKSRGVLTLYMKDGETYEFLRYSGLTENQVFTLQSCIRELRGRNPEITVSK